MSSPRAGVIGAPATPFRPGGEIDYDGFARIVGFLCDHGVDGLAVPLHTGESPSLSVAERKRLVEVAIEAAGDRAPVLAHVSMPGTGEAVDLARHAESAGAAAVVAVTPYHWRPSPRALTAHYEALASSVGVGVWAYNFPSSLGVAITPNLLEALIDRCPNFAGLKDASYDMQSFTECARRAGALRPDFALMTGVEYLLPSMCLGGSGCFSPSSAIAPRLVRRLYQACAEGDLDTARVLQYRMSGLWHLLKETGYPASVKAAMAILGRPVGGVRLPLLDPDAEGVARLRAGLEELGICDEEPSGWT